MKSAFAPSKTDRHGASSTKKAPFGIQVPWGGAKPAFSTMVMPELSLGPAGLSQVQGTHCFRMLLSGTAGATVSGVDGLVLAHFKPQSLPEFDMRFSWNEYQKQKTYFVRNSPSSLPQHSGDSEAKLQWDYIRARASDGTHAIFLDRLPWLCKMAPAIREGLLRCNMSTACLDCSALKRLRGCPASSNSELKADFSEKRLAITGRHRMQVIQALRKANLTKAGGFVLVQKTAIAQAAQIVHTDIDDTQLICSQPCSRLNFLDPSYLDAATIASRVKLMMAPEKLAFPRPFPKSGVPCLGAQSKRSGVAAWEGDGRGEEGPDANPPLQAYR